MIDKSTNFNYHTDMLISSFSIDRLVLSLSSGCGKLFRPCICSLFINILEFLMYKKVSSKISSKNMYNKN